jgi:hypothetical protein
MAERLLVARSGHWRLIAFMVILKISNNWVCVMARIALVIGNGGYEHAPLKNPVNDAALMVTIQ